jgi:hypothetical protein
VCVCVCARAVEINPSIYIYWHKELQEKNFFWENVRVVLIKSIFTVKTRYGNIVPICRGSNPRPTFSRTMSKLCGQYGVWPHDLTTGKQPVNPLKDNHITGFRVNVCTGLVAQIMFGSGTGSGLLQIITVRSYIEHPGLYRAILSSEKNFTVALTFRSWYSRAPNTNPTHLILSEIFAAVLFHKQFEKLPYKLGIPYFSTIPRKIMSDILRASLNK